MKCNCGAYMGATVIECPNRSCRHFSPRQAEAEYEYERERSAAESGLSPMFDAKLPPKYDTPLMVISYDRAIKDPKFDSAAAMKAINEIMDAVMGQQMTPARITSIDCEHLAGILISDVREGRAKVVKTWVEDGVINVSCESKLPFTIP